MGATSQEVRISVRGAGALAPLGTNFEYAYHKTNPDSDGRKLAPNRAGRKSGGRVVNHAQKAAELVMAAERAKKGHAKTTEPLLQQDDSAIAKALSVANQHI